MRVFTCLSKNVSMALERSQRSSSDKRPKNRLTFRNKKRRAAASAHNSSNENLGTPSKKHASSTRSNCSKKNSVAFAPRSIYFQDENAPPPSSTNYSSADSVTSRKTLVPPTKPLPAIPTSDLDISVYIRELDDSNDDVENDSNYLPLAHIEPPLTEEETTASSSSPSPLSRPVHRRGRRDNHRNSHYSASTDYATSTTSGVESSPSSQNIYQQIPEVNANRISCAKVSNVKSVGSFNEAFIQSSSSLPRLRNVLSSTRLDDCANSAPRRVQKKVTTATASTSTSDIKPLMTYSRRKAAYAKNQISRKNRQRAPQNDSRCYYSDEAMSRHSSDSLSSRVEEVSDLLEASVAEYSNHKQNTHTNMNVNNKRQSSSSGISSNSFGSSRGTSRRTDFTVEVCDDSDDNNTQNDCSLRSGYDSQTQTQSQISADDELTQLSQFTGQDLTQYSQEGNHDTIVTGAYSRLVDYTASTTTSSTADDQSQYEESIFYENEVRPLRLCEGESQTSLISPKGFQHHRNRGVGASSINTNVTGGNSDYSQVIINDNYHCASQSSLPSYMGDTETELTADYYDDTTSDVTSPSYVNVSKECSRTVGGDYTVDDVVTDADNVTCSDSRASEFLGCMSFGVPHLLKKDLDGWYYLLTEEVGRKKHLQARGIHTAATKKPVLTSRGPPNVPIPNLSVEGQEKTVITVLRGKNGFGFSFVDELPPKIGRVDKASPAEQAGVQKGDEVISINGKNVSRSTSKGVAHLVKQMKAKSLTLELHRDHVMTGPTTTTSTSTSTSTAAVKRSVGTSAHNNTDHLYESIMGSTNAAGRRDHHKENLRAVAHAEEDFLTDDDYSQNYGQNDYYNDSRSYHGGSMPNLKALTSTPMPRAAMIHRPASTQVINRNRQESIHRLMSIELDFIDFMHYGIERYSRPLRHCIISAPQHGTMFQNVEKLVTISEFHIKQLQENAPSSVNSEDTDDSQSSESSSMFPNSVALIYQSKIHMLCQAYETYTHGLTHSNQLLRQLRSNQDFMNFIKDPSTSKGGNYSGGSMFGHPSISAFINRPVQHINELYTVFNEIFAGTSPHSPDFPVLQKISTKLAQCITAITDLSSRGRVHSLDSLTSSQGCSTSQTTSSGKGSMASLTSCSSAETETLRTMRPPPPPSSVSSMTSASSHRPVDQEVARVQERLVFPPHIPTFQLCEDDRHIIFQGDIFRLEQGKWYKSHMLLLSDLLLLLDQEVNGNLRVVDTPFYLSDLSGLEVNRKHASEFVLHLHTTTPYSAIPHPHHKRHNPHQPTTRPVILRAPSAQEKFMWKSLLEQRVSSVSGSKLQHYGSMREISNVKTSVVL